MTLNWKEVLYNISPIYLQNLLVGIYGLKLKKERYSRSSQEFLKSLLQSEFNSASANRTLQNNLFNHVANIAIKQTQFYRNYFRTNECLLKSEWNIKDLCQFPVIQKSELQKNTLHFVNESIVKNNRYITFYTSGSTGTPLKVYSTREHRSNHYAFFSRLRINRGLQEIPRRATLFGRIIIPPKQKMPPFWRYDWAQKNLLMSSYHLSKANLSAYINKLRSYKPEEIFSYPSSLYELARYINENNQRPLSTPLVMTTAEHLSDYQRLEIEKAFTCKVINQYGCTEMAFFASECEFGCMHVSPEHGFVEILKEDGTIATEGRGELIATGFVNTTMPVIRYRVGDIVTLTSEYECKCGRNTQVFTSVDGRVDDTIYKLDGTPVGRIDPIFKGDLKIKAACVVQDNNGDIDIKVIPKEGFSKADKQSLIFEMHRRVGTDISVNVTEVVSLPKSRNGKFRPVISSFKPSSFN